MIMDKWFEGCLSSIEPLEKGMCLSTNGLCAGCVDFEDLRDTAVKLEQAAKELKANICTCATKVGDPKCPLHGRRAP